MGGRQAGKFGDFLIYFHILKKKKNCKTKEENT